MAQKVDMHTRVYEDLAKWLREYAAERGWTASKTICELLAEKRKDIEYRDAIRRADPGRDIIEQLNRRLERKQQESI